MGSVLLKLYASINPFLWAMVFYHNWKVASTMSEHLLYATYKEMYTPCATETYD